MPYIHFAEEQKRQANQVDLVEFLRCKGEPLIRSGPEYRLASNHAVLVHAHEHRVMVFLILVDQPRPDKGGEDVILRWTTTRRDSLPRGGWRSWFGRRGWR